MRSIGSFPSRLFQLLSLVTIAFVCDQDIAHTQDPVNIGSSLCERAYYIISQGATGFGDIIGERIQNNRYATKVKLDDQAQCFIEALATGDRGRTYVCRMFEVPGSKKGESLVYLKRIENTMTSCLTTGTRFRFEMGGSARPRYVKLPPDESGVYFSDQSALKQSVELELRVSISLDGGYDVFATISGRR
jgi:hypothetical protein